jgi:hypothetical protein
MEEDLRELELVEALKVNCHNQVIETYTGQQTSLMHKRHYGYAPCALVNASFLF